MAHDSLVLRRMVLPHSGAVLGEGDIDLALATLENDFEPEYITVRGKAKILKELQSKAKKASRVLLASDNDREGEAMRLAKHKSTIVLAVAIALMGISLAGAELDQAMNDFKAGKYAEAAAGFQALVVWQSSQLLPLVMWPLFLPVAAVPLWQLAQGAVTVLWSKLTADQLLVVWQSSQVLELAM